jgi:pyrroloquinoline quinone biosynthesis protein E
VEEARRLGALQVLLSGGEPLTRRDLSDVVAACQPRRMLVTMCTSGAGLSGDKLRRLARAGLAVIVFSLDGLEAATHDGNRGIRGLHARVLSAALEAREAGMKVIFNTVATKEKLAGREIADLAALAEGHGATLNLTIPTPQGRWEGDEGVVLDVAARGRLEAVLRHPNVRTDVDSTYGRRGCPAAVEKVSVDPYGNLRPCPLLPAVWGSVREEPLSALWSRMRAHPGVKERASFCPAADLEFRERHSDLF